MARTARMGFGGGNIAVALLVAVSVFRLLPTRWWVVDAGAIVVAGLLATSGVMLLRDHPEARRVTRVASGVVLALGLALFSALVVTAAWISGVYGQVGMSGAVVFGLVSLLVLPYIVVLPAIELVWARKP